MAGYLDEHYDRRVSLADLARMVELNPVYLVRSFGSTSNCRAGISKAEPLEPACRVLRLGAPASEVTYAVGFADQSHLTRVFKQVLGVTPAQYAIGS